MSWELASPIPGPPPPGGPPRKPPPDAPDAPGVLGAAGLPEPVGGPALPEPFGWVGFRDPVVPPVGGGPPGRRPSRISSRAVAGGIPPPGIPAPLRPPGPPIPRGPPIPKPPVDGPASGLVPLVRLVAAEAAYAAGPARAVSSPAIATTIANRG